MGRSLLGSDHWSGSSHAAREAFSTVSRQDRRNAVADLIAEIAEQAAERGDLDRQNEEMNDDAFIALIDAFASNSHPLMERLQELMAERGWSGWSRMERADDPSRSGTP